MTAAREKLPNRRASFSFNFNCGAHQYTATVSYFPGSDRIAEIFLGNGRAGSDVDATAKDSAILASIGLQFGAPLNVLRKALLRDSQGRASTPIGCVLDLLAERQS